MAVVDQRPIMIEDQNPTKPPPTMSLTRIRVAGGIAGALATGTGIGLNKLFDFQGFGGLVFLCSSVLVVILTMTIASKWPR
jgi:predicted lipid-binding transport protein (Tim44 family)